MDSSVTAPPISKANYPVEFMAALLSNEINNTDKISVFVAECQRMGDSHSRRM
ncbi:MAG: hypothetical protein R3F31_27245 [Verrucomicrobiales bacterium]